MSERESGQAHVEKTETTSDETTAEAQDAAAAGVRERHEKLADDVDSILDDIDDVLEANAEDFVKSYVQKGGE